MDPDEALRQIRLLIAQLRTEDTVGNPDAPLGAFRQHARDLAETVEGLDEWLTKGGFKPDAWNGVDNSRPIIPQRHQRLSLTFEEFRPAVDALLAQPDDGPRKQRGVHLVIAIDSALHTETNEERRRALEEMKVAIGADVFKIHGMSNPLTEEA